MSKMLDVNHKSYDDMKEAYMEATKNCKDSNCCHSLILTPLVYMQNQLFVDVNHGAMCSLVPSIPPFSKVKDSENNVITEDSAGIAQWGQQICKHICGLHSCGGGVKQEV